MARGNKYTCRICGTEYHHCPKCHVKPIQYLNSGFCSQDCMDIYDVVSAYICKVKDVKETADALTSLNIKEKNFVPEVRDVINDVMSKSTPIITKRAKKEEDKIEKPQE